MTTRLYAYKKAEPAHKVDCLIVFDDKVKPPLAQKLGYKCLGFIELQPVEEE